MKNSARYIVTTHWGTFSLDRASYEDYLAGKHWIGWSPKKNTRPPSNGYMPPNVTDHAIELRNKADQEGILSTLQQLGFSAHLFPDCSKQSHISIDELCLSVRSCNGLKRAGVMTFGELKELIDSDGLLTIRNLGQKSATEIRQTFLAECYARLLPYEKAEYWQNLLDNRYRT